MTKNIYHRSRREDLVEFCTGSDLLWKLACILVYYKRIATVQRQLLHNTLLFVHIVFDELIELRMKGEVVAQICGPSEDLIGIDLHCLAYI